MPADPEARQAVGAHGFGELDVTPLLVPHDCLDGFYQAYWRRPHAYLDERVRANIAVYHRLPAVDIERAVTQLRYDLDTGAWTQRNRGILAG